MALPITTKLTPRVEDIVRNANRQFEDVVPESEAKAFDAVTLDEVKQAARHLERTLDEKGDMPNMARLQDFYAGAEQYEQMCGKMDRTVMKLPWIWAPMIPLLQTSSEDRTIIKAVISAFKEIGHAMSSAGLTKGASEEAETQEILALIYDSVLEVHRRLFGLVRTAGWRVFFQTSWARFEKRLRRIRREIAQLAGLLGQNGTSAQLAKAREDREEWREELEKVEKETADKEMKNVVFWLSANELDQQDSLDNLVDQCHPQSCDWIYENGKIKMWMRRSVDNGIVWLKGKPGSGKSVLCSTLIKKLQASPEVAVLYLICTETQPREKYCHFVLRTLVWQLIRSKPDLAAVIEARYINAGVNPPLSELRELLALMISTFPAVRLVVDGFDQCEKADQEKIWNMLSPLAKSSNSGSSCKILISSQDSAAIPRNLRYRASVDLSNEDSARIAVEAAITSHGNLDEEAVLEIENMLLNKADAMFLYVRLVLVMIQEATTRTEIVEYLKGLPPGLDEIYRKIFERLLPSDDVKRDQVSRVFQLLTYGKRPLKKFEIRDAVTLRADVAYLNDNNRVRDSIFDLCKPLVEIAPDDTVRFIHGSVKDYLLKYHSLFSDLEAQGNIAMSCVKYLVCAVSLIDPEYGLERKRLEVAKGYHGLCSYASKHVVYHLLAYLELDQGSVRSEFRDSLLLAAEGLASLVQRFAPHKKPGVANDKLTKQCESLSARPALFSLVVSERVLLSRISTRPRRDVPVVDQQGFGRIRGTYEELARALLQAQSVTDLDPKILLSFQKIYGTSVLICRFGACSRGLHGFATSKERDEHELTHRLDLRCPYEDCPSGRLSFRSVKRRDDHLKHYHDEEPVKMTEPVQGPGIARVDTEATLVNDSQGKTSFDDLISLPPWDEEPRIILRLVMTPSRSKPWADRLGFQTNC